MQCVLLFLVLAGNSALFRFLPTLVVRSYALLHEGVACWLFIHILSVIGEGKRAL